MSTIDSYGELPVVGPYDLGTITTRLLRGKVTDDDKYKVLKNLGPNNTV